MCQQAVIKSSDNDNVRISFMTYSSPIFNNSLCAWAVLCTEEKHENSFKTILHIKTVDHWSVNTSNKVYEDVSDLFAENNEIMAEIYHMLEWNHILVDKPLD